MKFKIEEQFLKVATPYMLRQDGQLTECSPLHPYIYYNVTDDAILSIEKLLNTRIDHLLWFYNNTSWEVTKQQIKVFVNSVLHCDYLKVYDHELEKLFDFEHVHYTDNLFDLEEIYKALNNLTNEEFLRVRTSDLKFGGSSKEIYFRVSSVDFNWFDNIWQIVFENDSFIENVTITNDTQSRPGPLKYYKHNGTIINHLPTKEFLTLSGNPIIESLNSKFNFKWFEEIHPGHINNRVDLLWEEYTEKHFK